MPYPCSKYRVKGYPTLTTQCDLCGWDSSEHVLDGPVYDQRVARVEGRYPTT